MTARAARGRDTQVVLQRADGTAVDLTPHVANFSVTQSVGVRNWFNGWGNGLVEYGRQTATLVIEGLWSAPVDRLLSPLAHEYEVMSAGYEGPVTFRAEWTIGEVTRAATDTGQTTYHTTLPLSGQTAARLAWTFDAAPVPAWPMFTVTPAPRTRYDDAEATERFRASYTHRLREVEAANARARTLLFAHLSEAQREEYDRRGVVTETLPVPFGRVEVSEGGVRFLDDQYPLVTRARYCLVPDVDFFPPPADTVLARLLWLRHDPAGFLRIANRVG